MPSWQAMDNKAYGEIITESDMDKIRENLEFLGGLTAGGASLDSLAENAALDGAGYDSGWFAVAAGNTYTKAHGMGSKPTRVTLLFATSASPAGSYYEPQMFMQSAYTSNILLRCNDTNVKIDITGTSWVAQDDGGAQTSGYYRVLAW